MELVRLAKGMATFVLPAKAYAQRATGGTNDPVYCYSVFMRHMAKLHRAGMAKVPNTVLEIGPGDSLGCGLAALISGSERYYGVDLLPYANPERDVAIFDALVEMFRERAPIPVGGAYNDVRPPVDCLDFPGNVFADERLDKALRPARLQAIRDDVGGRAGRHVSYIAPWAGAGDLPRGAVDWSFSQATLMYIDPDALAGMYRTIADWGAPGSFTSHQVSFSALQLSKHWNGHWVYSPALWKVVRGRWTWVPNRSTLSDHIESMTAAGFAIALAETLTRGDGLHKEKLAAAFKDRPEEDLVTWSLFAVGHKNAVAGVMPPNPISPGNCGER